MNSKIEKAMCMYWGERCSDFDADCPCCLAWKELDAMIALLKGYEQWEGDVIMDNDCWRNCATLPTITQPLWGRLLELQGERNAILRPKDSP